MTAKPEQRFAQITMTAELMFYALVRNPRTKDGFVWASVEGVPDDAVVVDATYDYKTRFMTFLLSHPSFPVRAKGIPLPMLDVTARRCCLSLNAATPG